MQLKITIWKLSINATEKEKKHENVDSQLEGHTVSTNYLGGHIWLEIDVIVGGQFNGVDVKDFHDKDDGHW